MTSPSNRSKPSANAGALAHVSKTPDAPTAAFHAFILCLPDIPDSACIVAKWDCVTIDVRNLPWTPRKKNGRRGARSEEHTSELQSLMRISYAVFCLKKKKQNDKTNKEHTV